MVFGMEITIVEVFIKWIFFSGKADQRQKNTKQWIWVDSHFKLQIMYTDAAEKTAEGISALPQGMDAD